MATDAQGRTVPNAAAKGWRVVGQQPQLGLDAHQRPVQGMLVRFTTGLGVPGEIFVPMGEYSRDGVRAAVAAQAGLIDSVHQLQG